MKKASRRGVTLVQLLLVVSLCAIPTLLLFAIFQREQLRAQRQTCQTNLKQIALAFKLYMNDYDERYPMVFGASTPKPKTPHGWADALVLYTKTAQVFQCPSDTNPASTVPATPGYTDYYYNANLVRGISINGRRWWTGANEAVVGSKAQTVLVGEGGNTKSAAFPSTYNQCGDGKALTGGQQTCSPSKPGLAVYPSAQIHLGGAHFLFADGSVKWLKGDNASQSAQVLNNGASVGSIGGKKTFSLLNS